jgi:hypothetical protein
MVAPLLDDAINELGPEDRTAILLRFFELQEFRAVGEIMGSNEDAARMRVNRALAKLHEMLAQRGVVLSAAALGTALAAEAVTAAPSGMVASVAATALGGAAAGGAALTIMKILSMTKVKIAIASAIVVAAFAVPIVQHEVIQALRLQNEGLKQQAEQTATLQEQLAHALQDRAKAAEAPLPVAQVRELARLRNEVAQLREQTNELARARQQIQALNQRAAAGGAPGGAAVIATPSGVFPSQEQSANICLKNLRLIEEAKEKWASENHKQTGDTPTMEDLRPYFGQGPDGTGLNGIHGVLPNGVVVEELAVCPGSGVYKIGAIGKKPTCSIPGHNVPYVP